MKIRIGNANAYKGVHAIKTKRGDGTYFYLWRGGPRIETSAPIGSKEFHIAWTEAVEAHRPDIQATSGKTVANLIRMFETSSEFTSLGHRTQADYRRHLAAIETKFGRMSVKALEAPAVRGVFKEWRDELGLKSKRQADCAWTVLARLLSVSLDRGLIRVNPCTSGGKLYRVDRSDKIWTSDQIETFLGSAPKHLQLPFLLALWTGQREGDILRMEWTQYNGSVIQVPTSKTGEHVSVHIGKDLKRLLDTTKRTAPTICTKQDGASWRPSADGQWGGFTAAWREAMIQAGLHGQDLHFHDLRGTAITRLADASCSVPEIRSLTGHCLATINKILERYLARTPTQSRNAIQKLEKHLKGREKAA
jgi:integrase